MVGQSRRYGVFTIQYLYCVLINGFFFLAFEIDEEDGNLVDYFVDDLPVREIEVDQDEDQFVPEKIARAATYEFSNFEF